MSSQIEDAETAVLRGPSPPLDLASFPSEILGEIFLATIPVLGNIDGFPSHFPWSLSHVCRDWRTSALAFPKVWSFLDVEQKRENEEGSSPTLLLTEAYLERSGQHPLTFRLSYEFLDKMPQTLLQCLTRHAPRWQNVLLEYPNHSTFEYLAQRDASEFPSLRTLDCSYSEFKSGKMKAGPILHPIPWSQLQRYHEYRCAWSPDHSRQSAILSQLINVVYLRVSFEGGIRKYGTSTIKMPHLRFASLGIYSQADKLHDLLNNCFDFPCIQGLNLRLGLKHSRDALCPMPAQFKSLKVLRLCGNLAISNDALLCILTEIATLTYLAVELTRGFDGGYLFTLLTPARFRLAMRLLTLQLSSASPVDYEGAVDNSLFVMLGQRFGGGAEFARLQRFEFFLPPRPGGYGILQRASETPTTVAVVDNLESLRVQEGWDIRVTEKWPGYDFWGEEMDEGFL